MKNSREYASDVQRKRSANSPWRKQTMVMTNKAVAKRKKVEQTPAGTPRPDLD
jgi:hypothetical protein